jgi:hypothetical protein
LPIARELPVRVAAEAAGISEREVKKLRAGHSQPNSKTEQKLTTLGVTHARQQLSDLGIDVRRNDHEALARYIDRR